MIFYSKQLSVVELIMNVSIHYETDDKWDYVIILLPLFFRLKSECILIYDQQYDIQPTPFQHEHL